MFYVSLLLYPIQIIGYKLYGLLLIRQGHRREVWQREKDTFLLGGFSMSENENKKLRKMVLNLFFYYFSFFASVS
jgi:hypothetical protein